MKILQINIEEFSKSLYFQNIKTENDKLLLNHILECVNSHLKYEQKDSDVQKKRENHVLNLAIAKRFATEKLIADYVGRVDLFGDDVDKYKIANIAKHVGRTDKTIRNVLTEYAEMYGIDLTEDKLQNHVPFLCDALMKKCENW